MTTYFVNFNRTLLAYVLAKAMNHLAMLLAQQNREVIRHFYMLTYYSNNEDPNKKMYSCRCDTDRFPAILPLYGIRLPDCSINRSATSDLRLKFK